MASVRRVLAVKRTTNAPLTAAGLAPVVLTVTLTVTAPVPSLAFAPAALSLTADGSGPVSGTVALSARPAEVGVALTRQVGRRLRLTPAGEALGDC